MHMVTLCFQEVPGITVKISTANNPNGNAAYIINMV